MKITNQEKNKQDYSNLANLANQARDLKEQYCAKAMQEGKEGFAMYLSCQPLNYFIKLIYNLHNKELDTFLGWKKKGYKVKKGAKGYLFFSTPKTFKKEIENSQGQKEEISFNRFCKCFLFSQDQVEQTIN